jgi:hypothetical protein
MFFKVDAALVFVPFVKHGLLYMQLSGERQGGIIRTD